ncbi:hypothetical protein QBC46DRAFT_152507 [Diplogelasinospora grovesii]|uniref:Uncharacterized protein n=1 Tax=Diplogelasinospora grovesii TaxID=303347 RepID=A0AAN6N514_9PEZI|nr:hypothetical protein QBC46DRAFT_152507 [Diplogelasinospora grovesii]
MTWRKVSQRTMACLRVQRMQGPLAGFLLWRVTLLHLSLSFLYPDFPASNLTRVACPPRTCQNDAHALVMAEGLRTKELHDVRLSWTRPYRGILGGSWSVVQDHINGVHWRWVRHTAKGVWRMDMEIGCRLTCLLQAFSVLFRAKGIHPLIHLRRKTYGVLVLAIDPGAWCHLC